MFLINAQYEKGQKRDKQTISSLVDFGRPITSLNSLSKLAGAVVIRHMKFSRVLIWRSLESLTKVNVLIFQTGIFYRKAKNAFDGVDDETAGIFAKNKSTKRYLRLKLKTFLEKFKFK